MENYILYREQLEFFGKITASVTHELNNVLSIINEYTGLLKDLTLLAEQGKSLDLEKIQKIICNIEAQIKRKKDIIKLLNKFSHRVDTVILNFNLFESLNEIVLLSRRFAALKKVNLEMNIQDFNFNINNSPFIIENAVFLSILLSLQYSAADSTIQIYNEQENAFVNIFIKSTVYKDDVCTKANLETLENLLHSVKGDISVTDSDKNERIIKLTIPCSINELHLNS